ncbi:LysM peptidoglycan-binding domain-containing protein [bacterium]|nr:LysM peptidoglycan-binding domain-containing protein [bacterium]
MKSSTIKRSALSRETIDVIENIAQEESMNNNYKEEENYLPREYVREDKSSSERDNKSQEIDLLWQTFKSAQFNTNSPIIQIVGGFFLGIISTIIVFSLLGVFALNSNSGSKILTINFGALNKSQPVKTATVEENSVTAQIAGDEENIVEENSNEEETIQETSSNSNLEIVKKYTIKDGDTVEAIIRKNYGTYNPEIAQAIMKANNLSNLDRISIGQVLLLPAIK